VRNGADLAALAEHTRGVAIGCDNVIYLHGDAGIGGGFIAGGRPITGHGGHGGEVGHMVVNPQGQPVRLWLARVLGDRGR
jgi:predicted NBD/HSP70 family sugar kinase